MADVVQVADLRKSFGSVHALEGVSFDVAEGSVHGLLGPNGAGKSTLLRILLGMVRPSSGYVRVLGRSYPVGGLPESLDGVAGFVDRPAFYSYLRADRTLRLLAEADGLGEVDVDGALARVGLSGAAHRKVAGWSTGMRQRLGIAALLIRKPRLLILDEPTEGLDPSGGRDLLGLVRSLADDGVTVLISSHDMAEVDAVCDDVTILSHGRVARSAPLEDLRRGAPLGRHRVHTSDDGAARLVAEAGHAGVVVEHHPRGGLTVDAGGGALHRYICDLGRADISVQAMELEVSPLVALFYSLTEDADPVLTGAGTSEG